MSKKNIHSFIFLFISLVLLQTINTKIEIIENKRGEIDGYSYILWKSDNIGLTTMTIENPYQFSCSWTNVDNVLFLLGKTMKYEISNHNLTDIIINYDLEYKPEGQSYISINGYFSADYEEFNIVENSDNWNMRFTQSLGNITVDDGTYDIYYNEIIYPPNIHGIQKKIEFWSIRREKRSSGSISFGKHFEAWMKKGLQINMIRDIYMKIEAYQSSGSANVNNFELNLDDY